MSDADAWAALRKEFQAWAAMGENVDTFIVGAKNAKWMKDRGKFANAALKRMDELGNGTTLEAVDG